LTADGPFYTLYRMWTFYMNEAALDLPDDAVDRSTTHVVMSTESGMPATFEVERLNRGASGKLQDDYASYVSDLRVRLRRFSVVFQREGLVDDEGALEVGVRWQNADQKAMYTRQTHLYRGATWVILAIEGAFEAREELDALFERLLATLRFRTD
jgi:hypothetical protein